MPDAAHALAGSTRPDEEVRPTLGAETARYADALSMELSLAHQSVVIDIFDDHAITASPTPLSEQVLDALYMKGLPAIHVSCTGTELYEFQSKIYATEAVTRAEVAGASANGVISWARRSVSYRARTIALPIFILLILSYFAPGVMLWFGACLLCAIILFRIWATQGALKRSERNTRSAARDTVKITVLVPLFKEGAILPSLLRRLSKLSYPMDNLEIFLLIEAADKQTQAALASLHLPPHIRPFIVARGTVQTKPRAMNAVLPYTNGEIIGVYDAEDAPAPMQLTLIAEAFEKRRDIACLQAPLDIYNAHASLLSRCFAIEYAMLFRIQNPTLSAHGAPLPLGGTSFFVRRDALLQLGAWDAFNVTEDADLGLRLFNAGYKTEMVHIPTFEEAPTEIHPWIRQRSRWLKGFLLTGLTQPKDAFGLFTIALLFGPVIAALFTCATLPLWFVTAFGTGQPLPTAFYLFTTIALISELSLFHIGWRATKARHLRKHRWALLVMPFYRLLLIPALIKALWEAATAPTYWDKTQHGADG